MWFCMQKMVEGRRDLLFHFSSFKYQSWGKRRAFAYRFEGKNTESFPFHKLYPMYPKKLFSFPISVTITSKSKWEGKESRNLFQKIAFHSFWIWWPAIVLLLFFPCIISRFFSNHKGLFYSSQPLTEVFSRGGITLPLWRTFQVLQTLQVSSKEARPCL